MIGGRVIDGGGLTDPEDGGDDVPFPGITIETGAIVAGGKDLGFDLEQSIFPQTLGELLKVRTGRNGGLRLRGQKGRSGKEPGKDGGGEFHGRI